MQGHSARCDGRLCVGRIEVQYDRSGGECLGISVPYADFGRKSRVISHPIHGQRRLPPTIYEARRPGRCLHRTGFLGNNTFLYGGMCAQTSFDYTPPKSAACSFNHQMYLAFSGRYAHRARVWSVWFVLFGVEMWTVTGLSLIYPDIGFKNTHLNTRMGLLTLIIIGEGVIAITRIVNKTVRPGGWTKWSFVHILGVTTNVVSSRRA